MFNMEKRYRNKIIIIIIIIRDDMNHVTPLPAGYSSQLDCFC